MTIFVGNAGELEANPKSWIVYLIHFEQFVICDSIPVGQISTFLIVMGPNSYGLLCDLLSSAAPGTSTYATITAAARDHFSPVLLMIGERY